MSHNYIVIVLENIPGIIVLMLLLTDSRLIAFICSVIAIACINIYSYV